MNLEQRIEEIKNNAEEQFENGEIRKGLLTYRQLQIMSPQDKEFYLVYLQYLEDEFVIAELLWNAYEESLECCERAIINLPATDSFYFYLKKLELYILMTDQDYSWFGIHRETIQNYIKELLQKYPDNIEILKRLMALNRVMGNHEEEQRLLNQVYALNPDDSTLLTLKVAAYENKADYSSAIEILERWLRGNTSISFYHEIAYKKLADLYTKISNDDKANHYQNLLDNIK